MELRLRETNDGRRLGDGDVAMARPPLDDDQRDEEAADEHGPTCPRPSQSDPGPDAIGSSSREKRETECREGHQPARCPQRLPARRELVQEAVREQVVELPDRDVKAEREHERDCSARGEHDPRPTPPRAGHEADGREHEQREAREERLLRRQLHRLADRLGDPAPECALRGSGQVALGRRRERRDLVRRADRFGKLVGDCPVRHREHDADDEKGEHASDGRGGRRAAQRRQRSPQQPHDHDDSQRRIGGRRTEGRC